VRDLIDDISGKTALVTGASSGMGRAIALRLAAAGVEVTALGRNEAELSETSRMISAGGGTCHTLPTDIASEGAMSAAIKQSIALMGQLDILINSAAVMYMHDVTETPRSRWGQMLDINLLALIEGCEAAIAHMRKTKRDGRIVNISSLAGRLPGGSIYGASKIAVEKYTDELRSSLEQDNIRVTAIIPGGFSTNLGRDLSDAQLSAFQSRLGETLAKAPTDEEGRSAYFGLADDIARAVLFAVAQPSLLNISEMVVRPARNIDPSAFSTP